MLIFTVISCSIGVSYAWLYNIILWGAFIIARVLTLKMPARSWTLTPRIRKNIVILMTVGIFINWGVSIGTSDTAFVLVHTKLAEFGRSESMVSLGDYYMEPGNGDAYVIPHRQYDPNELKDLILPRDKYLAVRWYTKASELGNSSAKAKLSEYNLKKSNYSSEGKVLVEIVTDGD